MGLVAEQEKQAVKAKGWKPDVAACGGSPRSSVEAWETQWSKGGDSFGLFTVTTSKWGRMSMKETKSQPITKMMVWNAYRKVRANKGSAGIDGETIEAFDANLTDNLYKLWNRLASGSYFPPPVMAVEIPKDGGKLRKLGIPTVADRIAQTVVRDHLEPSVEPHFHPNSFGYRPNKGAHMAIAQARTNCWKMKWVIDLDIKAFFDEIDHGLLMRALGRHTSEKWVLMYVGRWLTAPMATKDGKVEERNMGTPQGGVISPLLANLFLHYAFDEWMRIHHPQLPFERYADDLIVHCRTKAEALAVFAQIEIRLAECKLRLNPDKTRIVYCRDSDGKDPHPVVSFDFLGFTFRPRKCRRRDTGKLFLGFTPAVSRKSLKKMNQKLKEMAIHRASGCTIVQLAKRLNPTLRGWLNYYQKYTPSALNWFFYRLNKRLVKWVRKTFKRFRTSEMKALGWLQEAARGDPSLFAHWKGGYMPEAATRVRRAV